MVKCGAYKAVDPFDVVEHQKQAHPDEVVVLFFVPPAETRNVAHHLLRYLVFGARSAELSRRVFAELSVPVAGSFVLNSQFLHRHDLVATTVVFVRYGIYDGSDVVVAEHVYIVS